MAKTKTPTPEDLKETPGSLLDYYKKFTEHNLPYDRAVTEEEWKDCWNGFIIKIKPAIVSEDKSLSSIEKAITLIKDLTGGIEALKNENKYGNSGNLYEALMLVINPTLREVSSSKIERPEPTKTTSAKHDEAPQNPGSKPEQADISQKPQSSTVLKRSASSPFKPFVKSHTI